MPQPRPTSACSTRSPASQSSGPRKPAAPRARPPPLLPDTAEQAQEIGDVDVIEAFEYYRTDRGQKDIGCVLFEAAHGATALGWDAFHLADELLDQPLLVVIGDKQGAFGAYRDGHEIYEKAASTDKELLELEGVSHYDLYEQDNGAGKALERVIPFFAERL